MKKRIVAMILSLSMLVTMSACGKGSNAKPTEGEKLQKEFALAKAVYPERVKFPTESEYKNYEKYNAAFTSWSTEQRKLNDSISDKTACLDAFTSKSVSDMFKNATSENVLYSPVNLYMALAILAETAAGDTRAEILAAMSGSTIEQIRKEAGDIWLANYKDDGYNMCLMGNSLWLSDSLKIKQDKVNLIANKYYASSFTGKMGSEKYDIAFRAWINENTKGLLEDYVKDLSMPADTAFAIASTIYYQGKWADEFFEGATSQEKFYVNGNKEKAINVDFMHATYSEDTVYFGEKFMAISLSIQNNGQMWLVLPDEGVTPAELSQDSEYLSFMNCKGAWEKRGRYKVELSLPKFDVSSRTDLMEMMKALGIKNAWEWGADFSNLVDTVDQMRLSKAEQAVRVQIDEKGVKAAAYTVIMSECATAMPQERKLIEFNLNRPFIFNITSSCGTLLFSGVVNNPVEE